MVSTHIVLKILNKIIIGYPSTQGERDFVYNYMLQGILMTCLFLDLKQA